ncbi:MAG: YicC family protein [Eubacteriaceae bacterium]|nr:YicC family protein [Eubacteriaceae bacterium]
MKSMTGFARIEKSNENYSVALEIKSVNHRYRDLFFRIPVRYSAIENLMRASASAAIARGHVEMTLRVIEKTAGSGEIYFNKALAESYIAAMQELSEISPSIASDLSADAIIALPGVAEVEIGAADIDDLWLILSEAMDEALEILNKGRDLEGSALKSDLEAKLGNIKAITEKIEKESESLPGLYAANLKKRLEALGTTIDDSRLLAELAIYADKSSIDEEITRLKLHYDHFYTEMQSSEPVGRKLDFLMQEINREANTVASKSSSFPISISAAEIKSELEKMREQIQNIE